MKDQQKPNGLFELQSTKNIRPDLSKQSQQIKKPTNKKENDARK